MALTPEDLRAMREIMQQEISREVRPIIQAELQPIREDIKRLNETVAKIENVHGYKLGVLFDAQIDANRNIESMQTLHDKVDDHDERIFALEQARKL